MKYFAPIRVSENIHKTQEGYLLCIGVPIGRTGEMVYGRGETPLDVGPNGTVLIMRDADELFRPETIASFEGKPFTIGHPEEFVGPENWDTLTHGILQNVRQGKTPDEDGEIPLIADLLITRKEAIEKIEGGTREVSCGYEAEYLLIEEGRGKQINIVGNHCALVDQGRAGTSYAINDHKAQERKGPIEMKKKKLMDSVKAIFGKAQDEAFKTIDAEMKEDDSGEVEAKDEGAKAFDELVSMVKDLSEKIGALSGAKSKDEESEEKPIKKKEAKKDDAEESEDEGEVEEPAAPALSVEERLERIEAAIAKLMEGESEEEILSEDEELEVEDDDAEEDVVLTGDTADTASRAEILSPGIAITKDVKKKALQKAFDSVEGKKIITALNGGKKPTFDSAKEVAHLFVAASEVLKATRSSDFSKTKKTRDSAGESDASVMTPEKMNEINAKRWGN